MIEEKKFIKIWESTCQIICHIYILIGRNNALENFIEKKSIPNNHFYQKLRIIKMLNVQTKKLRIDAAKITFTWRPTSFFQGSQLKQMKIGELCINSL